MLFATFYIIANIFQSYELWLLYRCFFGKSKRGAGIEFLAFVLFFAITMLLNVFIDIPILTGLSSYVMLVLIAFLGYESGWKQGLLYFCQHDFSRMYRGTCNRIFGFKCIPVERILQRLGHGGIAGRAVSCRAYDTKLSQSAERKRDSDSLLGGNDCAPGVFTLP